MPMSPEDYVRAAYRITVPHGFLGDMDYADELDFTQGWAKTCLLAVQLALTGQDQTSLEHMVAYAQNERAKARAARVAAIVAGYRLSSKQRPRASATGPSKAEREANTAALLAKLTGGA